MRHLLVRALDDPDKVLEHMRRCVRNSLYKSSPVIYFSLLCRIYLENTYECCICRTAGAIILKIAYGYSVAPHGPDPLVDLGETALDIFSKVCASGAWLVDIFPFRKCIPFFTSPPSRRAPSLNYAFLFMMRNNPYWRFCSAPSACVDAGYGIQAHCEIME